MSEHDEGVILRTEQDETNVHYSVVICHPQKWEYGKTNLLRGITEMNSKGKAGWEICSVSDGIIYWKRPIPLVVKG